MERGAQAGPMVAAWLGASGGCTLGPHSSVYKFRLFTVWRAREQGSTARRCGREVTGACMVRHRPRDREKQTSTDKMVPEVELMVLAGGLGVGQVAKGVKMRPSFLTEVAEGWGGGAVDIY